MTTIQESTRLRHELAMQRLRLAENVRVMLAERRHFVAWAKLTSTNTRDLILDSQYLLQRMCAMRSPLIGADGQAQPTPLSPQTDWQR